MNVGIHHNLDSFSDRWIEYCKENSINYKIVDCYESNIIQQLEGCDILMWHYHHGSIRDDLFAKQLLFSIEQSGKKVFPNFNTAWHFDDKVGQKYLLEAINASLVPSYVFYDKKSALNWVNSTQFPKVFKLRGGAGATNVSLAKNKKEAKQKIKIAFGKGFPQFDRVGHFKEFFQKYKEKKVNLKKLIKATGRLFITTEYSKMKGSEKGYVYFQDFIPNNDSDIRIIVIGDKAFGIKRMVRTGDFRASGSGKLLYLNNSNINPKCLQIAFETSEKLNAQCLAFDFVYDGNKNPLIVEISYGFAVKAYDSCSGYWDREFNYFEEKFNPQSWIVENIIKS